MTNQSKGGSKKLLLILDLNGTLLFRSKKASGSSGMSKVNQDLRMEPLFTVEGRKIYSRPHLQAFLDKIPDNVQLAIWTSAMQHTTGPVIKRLFPDAKKLFLFTWFRDKCTTHPVDFKFCLKDLRRVWQSYSQWNETNTILVDDSIEKGKLFPRNLLQIAEFDAFTKEAKSDAVLLNLSNWLQSSAAKLESKEVKDCRDLISSFRNDKVQNVADSLKNLTVTP